MRHVREVDVLNEVDQSVLEFLITVPAYYTLNLFLIVLVLLFGPLRHVLNVLLFVQWDLHRPAVRVHALQDLPILHACLEKGRIEREVDAGFDSLMLFERVDALILEISQAAVVANAAHRGQCRLRGLRQLRDRAWHYILLCKGCLAFYRLESQESCVCIM